MDAHILLSKQQWALAPLFCQNKKEQLPIPFLNESQKIEVID